MCLVCRRTFSGPEGVIKSEKYPSPYPDEEDCNWIIKVADDMKVKIEFEAFDLPSKKEICSNFLKLTSTGDLKNYIYCGNSIPPDYISGRNEVEVQFKTGMNTNKNTGFFLKYFSYKPTTTTPPTTTTTTITTMYITTLHPTTITTTTVSPTLPNTTTTPTSSTLSKSTTTGI